MAEPYFDNGVSRLVLGDARALPLSDESVHCAVTSPPYWGLRSYSLEPSVWGGDAGCEHEWEEEHTYQQMRRGLGLADSPATTRGGAIKVATIPDLRIDRASCLRCNAWCGCLGLEPTPELYVQHLVEVMREVWRVLRKDGTCWLNMGDSYSGSWGNYGARIGYERAGYSALPPMANPGPGLKPKDLVGIPWRLAFALQGFAVVPGSELLRAADILREARLLGDWELVQGVEGMLRHWSLLAALGSDGWLRSDIIWYKLNPMPESVTGRPTKAHEYVFLLTKAADYYYDADAIKEPMSDVTYKRLAQPGFDSQMGGPKDPGKGNRSERRALINQHEKLIRQEKWGSRFIGYKEWKETNSGRNRRTVWEIATQSFGMEMCEACGCIYTAKQYGKLPNVQYWVFDENTWEFKEKTPKRCRKCHDYKHWMSHFATFPEKLVEPCILAGTSERGCCPECGAPWERVVGKERKPRGDAFGQKEVGCFDHGQAGQAYQEIVSCETLGWRPTCKHEVEPVLCTVLDPFTGSGTVNVVAQKLGRPSVGVDLSEKYLALAQRRLEAIPIPMALEV